MSNLEIKLTHFTEAIRESLNQKNYYAALTLALTMPDICSKLEFPDKPTGKRYPEWFDKYVGPKYNIEIQKEKYCFLGGQDAYALRCALLHQGEIDITSQKARKDISKFLFVQPPESGMIHNNRTKETLQLQVDIFCLDICEGVENWISENEGNTAIESRVSNMIEIHQNITSF